MLSIKSCRSIVSNSVYRFGDELLLHLYIFYIQLFNLFFVIIV